MEKGQIGSLLSKFLDKMRLGVAPDCVLCNSAWHCPWSDWLAKRTFLETLKHLHWLIGWSMGVIHLCPQTSELSPNLFPLAPRHSLWLHEEFRTARHFKGILSKWKRIDQLFYTRGSGILIIWRFKERDLAQREGALLSWEAALSELNSN